MRKLQEADTGGVQKEDTSTQVFFCKYYEIFKNTYFEKRLRMNASEVSAEDIYNAQNTFKEFFRKLAEVKTQCGSDLMCFGLWQLKIPFLAAVQTFFLQFLRPPFITRIFTRKKVGNFLVTLFIA